MLPNDNQDQDQQQWDPTVLAYLQRQQDAQAKQDATNSQASTQDMIGAGTDIASAMLNRPSKAAVYLQHYNDTSAPKVAQAYQAKSNGDAARQVGSDMRAQGIAAKAADMKDAGTVAELEDKSHSRGLADNADSRAQSGEERAQTDFAHKQARQPAKDAFEDKSMSNQSDEMDAAKARRDPNSKTSQDFRSFVGKVAPDLANSLGNMSYEDAAKVVPGMANTYENSQARIASTQARIADKSDARTAKDSDKQDKNYTDYTHDMTTFKGDKAAQQANINLLKAKNAKSLLDENPNGMNEGQLHLFSSELAGIATAGVPTEHGVQAVMPSTLATKLAHLQEVISGNPQAANTKGFMQQYRTYLDELEKNSAETVRTRHDAIHKGWVKRLKPEDATEGAKTFGLSDTPDSSSMKGASAPQSAPVQVNGWDHFDAIQQGK